MSSDNAAYRSGEEHDHDESSDDGESSNAARSNQNEVDECSTKSNYDSDENQADRNVDADTELNQIAAEVGGISLGSDQATEEKKGGDQQQQQQQQQQQPQPLPQTLPLRWNPPSTAPRGPTDAGLRNGYSQRYRSRREVIGLLGYDFLWADAEHSTATPATIANQIMAAERRGLPTLVRIGYGYHDIIGHSQKYLVAGAQGIILPQCESSDDVRMIVDAVKFPPLGRRGLAGERWNAWGLGKEEEEQQQQEEEEGPPLGRRVQMANDNSVVGVVVESRRGIDALDDILSVKEVDFVFVAPTDLSSDVGLHGQIRHPDVVDMIDEAGRAIRAAGVSSGMLALTGDDYVFWRNRGFEVMAGVATNMFIDGATSLLHAARAHEITAARDGIATSIDDKGNRNGGATKS